MEKEGIGKITFWILPMVLFCGWINHIFWIIGFGNSVIPILLLLILISLAVNILKKNNWNKSDLRWLISPFLLGAMVLILPWWNYSTSQYTDTYYHVLEARNFAGFVNWAPSQQGLDFLFRPPIIPGVFAIELSLNNATWVTYTPLILTVATLWQIQHLAELWTTKIRSCLVVPAFLLLPSVRYWGQFQLLDIPVSGMFILVIHLLIFSNDKIQSKRNAQVLGSCVGLMFLTKYVFIYAIGICIWIMILDKNLQRSKWFVSGWLFITLPFLVYHTISYGNPLEALTTQSSFAINGISQTLGTYNSEQWWMDYNLEITGIGILGALSGMGVLFYRNKSELSSVLVILIPFIIIHAFILDYGTARYQIPLFALTVVLIIVSLPKVEQGLNPKLKNLNEILSTFGVVAIIYLSSIHASTINEEKIQYSTLVPRMDNIMEFYLNSSEMFPEDETVLTSKYIPIALHTGKQTARYLPTEDPLTDSLVDNEFNYALTSNYYPYRAWEKDFKPFFGNPIIEPIDFYRNENGTSILWEKGNDLWSNFPINFTTNGSLYGNMLELKHTQSAYFEQNTTIYWISQTSDINIENIVELYLDRTSEIGNQSCDFTTISGFCHLELGEILNATEQDIYIWIVKFT